MHRSNPHHGFHCERFDRTLLLQIVSIEIDIAVHRLQREQSIIIDDRTRSAWTKSVEERLEVETFTHVSAHNLLPTVLEARLKQEVEKLLSEEVYMHQPHSAESFVRFSFHRWLMEALHSLFKNGLNRVIYWGNGVASWQALAYSPPTYLSPSSRHVVRDSLRASSSSCLLPSRNHGPQACTQHRNHCPHRRG